MDYEAQAKKVAQQIGLGLKVEFAGGQCPGWCDKVKHTHGDRYRVMLTSGGKSISFDYWNSLRDKADGKRPTVYDILACVAREASMPTSPDDVVAELGEMKPSQAVAIATHAAKLQAFFTVGELKILSEVN